MSILVMSDIHGNLQALKAVLNNTVGEYKKIWVLGDIAGYGPEPGKCLDLLIDHGALIVAGNHDWAVCGKIDIAYFNSQAKAAIRIHQRMIPHEQKQILANLPIVLKRQSVTISHANPLDPIWGYVLDNATAASILHKAETSLTLVGHSHITALWRSMPEGTYRIPISYEKTYSYAEYPHLANPGSVGQSRDGDPSARYMILDTARKTMEFRNCQWQSGDMCRKMREQGYPENLIQRMTSGH